MLRARPVHWPTLRISLGRSLGPTTTSATTRMTKSSLHAISNIGFSHCRGRPVDLRSAGRPTLPAPDLRVARVGRAKCVEDRLDDPLARAGLHRPAYPSPLTQAKTRQGL